MIMLKFLFRISVLFFCVSQAFAQNFFQSMINGAPDKKSGTPSIGSPVSSPADFAKQTENLSTQNESSLKQPMDDQLAKIPPVPGQKPSIEDLDAAIKAAPPPKNSTNTEMPLPPPL